jgi:hypothetical protein
VTERTILSFMSILTPAASASVGFAFRVVGRPGRVVGRVEGPVVG